MKIRNDFVTNSSSSSFGTLRITCRPLVELLEKYKQQAEEEGLGEFPPPDRVEWTSGSDTASWEWSDGEFYADEREPNTMRMLLETFVDHLTIDSDGCVDYDLLESFEEDFNKHLSKFEEATERASFKNTDSDYGGDFDAYYDHRDVYPPEMLRKIMENVAQEHGYSVDDVTEYDFNVYVGRYMSLQTWSFEFDREKGIEKAAQDFTLLNWNS